jgi:hypothetical protein
MIRERRERIVTIAEALELLDADARVNPVPTFWDVREVGACGQ